MPAQLNNTHGRVRVCTVPVKHTETWVEHHALELVCSVQTSQMRMVSVLNYETAGSHSYLLKVWGDVVHRLDTQHDNKRSALAKR